MASSLKELLAKNVRFYRKYSNLTQFQLAERMNCSPAFIGCIENAKSNISFDTIDSLCGALGISPKILFSSSPKNNSTVLVRPILHEIFAVIVKYSAQ